MGWDLGQAKLSTVGVAPGFQLIYFYTIKHRSGTEHNCTSPWTDCYYLHNTDDSFTRSRA